MTDEERTENPLVAAAESGEDDGMMGGGNLYALDSDFDFHGHELKNAVHRGFVLDPNLTANAPAAPVEGQMFFDTTTHHPKYWNGTAWVQL